MKDIVGHFEIEGFLLQSIGGRRGLNACEETFQL